jgi:isoleucyl-tRNA synthetase
MTLQDGNTTESVHLEDFPTYDERLVDLELEDAVARMQRVVLLGRSLRNERKVKVRMPLPQITIWHRQQWVLDKIQPLAAYIQEELNVKTVTYGTKRQGCSERKTEPQLLGPASARAWAVGKKIATLSHEQMLTLEALLDGGCFSPTSADFPAGAMVPRMDRFISIECRAS